VLSKVQLTRQDKFTRVNHCQLKMKLWHVRTTMLLARRSLQNSSADGWQRVEIWELPTSAGFPASSRSSRWSLSSKWEPATAETALMGVLTARCSANLSLLNYRHTHTDGPHQQQARTTTDSISTADTTLIVVTDLDLANSQTTCFSTEIRTV